MNYKCRRIFEFILWMLVSENLVINGEVTSFKGDWILQDEYTIKTNEIIQFDFESLSKLDNTMYDMKLIDVNMKADNNYSQLCKVMHMRLNLIYDSSTLVYYNSSGDQSIQVSDFLILNGNILIYVLQNSSFYIKRMEQIPNQMEISITSLYETVISPSGAKDHKFAFMSENKLLFIYLSSGDIYCIDISMDNQSLLGGMSMKRVQGFENIKNMKHFLIVRGNLIFITSEGKVKYYQTVKKEGGGEEREQEQEREGGEEGEGEAGIFINEQPFEMEEESEIVDVDNHLNIIVLLDKKKGVYFYEFEENGSFTQRKDLHLLVERGKFISTQQLTTVVIATEDNHILEYYLDYSLGNYYLNREIILDDDIHNISLEERYLFISASGRNNNFFTPLNCLSDTLAILEHHQTILKFGFHDIQLKFTLFNNSSSSEHPQVKNPPQTLSKPNDSSPSVTMAFIQVPDGNRIEVVSYVYERETLMCSSKSEHALISNVNSKYEYAILYNSSDCIEKQRYFQSQSNVSSLEQRKSFCNAHGTVFFSVDFSEQEKEEFELGILLISLGICAAILSFGYYKNQKLSQMYAIKHNMQAENTNERKRINLNYQPISKQRE